jgi:multicomponent Na+:H+ antiporter subunit A
MPILAAVSGAAVASLTSLLPLTIGFFKDELLFGAALQRGPAFTALAAAVLTLAYIWRFWGSIFLGETQSGAAKIPTVLVAPVAVLGALVLAGGVVVEPFAELAKAAGSVSYAAAVEFVEPACLQGLNRLSDRAHTMEVRDLRGRIAAILVPSGVLVGGALVATPASSVFRIGDVGTGDLPLLLALIAATVASVATCLTRKLLLLPTLMAAVAILVKGYAEPGDGFSAGVVAALGILLQYLAFGREQVERLLPVRNLETSLSRVSCSRSGWRLSRSSLASLF